MLSRDVYNAAEGRENLFQPSFILFRPGCSRRNGNMRISLCAVEAHTIDFAHHIGQNIADMNVLAQQIQIKVSLRRRREHVKVRHLPFFFTAALEIRFQNRLSQFWCYRRRRCKKDNIRLHSIQCFFIIVQQNLKRILCSLALERCFIRCNSNHMFF